MHLLYHFLFIYVLFKQLTIFYTNKCENIVVERPGMAHVKKANVTSIGIRIHDLFRTLC